MNKINFKKLGMRLLFHAVLLAIALIPIILIFIKVDADLWKALTSGSGDKIVAAVQKYDNKYGVIIIAILQMVQDIAIVIPSVPIHIAAGVVLGKWKGFLVCHIADICYNLFVFLLYSKIKKTVDKFMPIDPDAKTVKFISKGQNPSYMVAMACLLPAIPNGFIPYAAVNAKAKLSGYILAISIGAAIPTFVLNCVGEMLVDGNWLLLGFLVALSFVGVFLLVKFQNQVIGVFDRIKGVIIKRNNVGEPEMSVCDEQMPDHSEEFIAQDVVSASFEPPEN